MVIFVPSVHVLRPCLCARFKKQPPILRTGNASHSTIDKLALTTSTKRPLLHAPCLHVYGRGEEKYSGDKYLPYT